MNFILRLLSKKTDSRPQEDRPVNPIEATNPDLWGCNCACPAKNMPQPGNGRSNKKATHPKCECVCHSDFKPLLVVNIKTGAIELDRRNEV